MPVYLRLLPSDAAARARRDLRMSGSMFLPPGRPNPQVGAGLLWRAKRCATCPGHPSLDVWHRVYECAALDTQRRAALSAAARRAAAAGCTPEQQRVFVDVGAMLHSRAARNFIFMATLGGVVTPRGVVAGVHGLPPPWLDMLLAPPSHYSAVKGEQCVAVTMTLLAFGSFACTVARHIVVAVPAVAPDGSTADAAVAAPVQRTST